MMPIPARTTVAALVLLSLLTGCCNCPPKHDKDTRAGGNTAIGGDAAQPGNGTPPGHGPGNDDRSLGLNGMH